MKIFLDTANLEEIEKILKLGIASGITTNPTIISQEPKTDYLTHVKKIVELCKRYKQEVPLSIEVFQTDPEKMVAQAKEFVEKLNYSNLNIKIPIGWAELGVIKELKKNNIKVNCTCGIKEAQAVLAASVDAEYFSLFCGRIRDLGVDPFLVISNVRKLLEGTNTKLIIGSIRQEKDITDSFLAGADIVTVPFKFLEKMAIHPKTTETVNQFINDFHKWMGQ